MTVGTLFSRNNATGDGVTTTFPFSFTLLQAADVSVFDTPLGGTTTQRTDFTVSPNGGSYPCVGGTITFNTAPALSDALVLIRILVLDQELILQNEAKLPALELETEYDRIVMQLQQLQEQINRCVQVPLPGSTAPNLPAGVPNDVLVWDATGTKILSVTPGTAMLNGISTSPIPLPGPLNDVIVWDGAGHLINVTPASLFAPASGITAPGTTVKYSLPTYNDTTGASLAGGIGVGTSGQVLTSNGVALPSFQALPSGLTLVVPSSLGKNKVISANSFNMITFQLSNGYFMQGGLNVCTAKGINNGFSSFSGVSFDPLNPPTVGSHVVDWAQNGTSLFVVFSDGKCYSAGRNDVGQLGLDSPQLSFNVLTQVPYFQTSGFTSLYSSTAKIVQVYCNPGGNVETYGQTFWVDNAGGIWAAGLNTSGQLGDSTLVNIGQGVTNHGVGHNGLGANTPVHKCATLAAFHGIQTQEGGGIGFSMLLDGTTLYATGDNTGGQLGQGNTTQLKVFTSITLSNVTSFKIIRTSDSANALAITSASSGSLYVWGINSFGQCGANYPTTQTSVGSALLTGIASADFMGSGQYLSTYALATNGDLYTWGANVLNNLFLAGTTTQQTPSKVMSTTCSKIWGWKGNGGDIGGAMYVLDTSNVMRFAGNVPSISAFPIATNPTTGLPLADTAFKASGAYRCSMPQELQDTTDTIADLILVNYGLTYLIKAFILTASGSLYGSGYSGDAMLTNYLYTAAQPTYTYNSRLNKFFWGN